jgi:CBS domain-containing protein
MKVQDVMTKDPACCLPDSGLQAVTWLMVENDCGCIPVVESRESAKIVGTITDRDIAVRAFTGEKNPLDLTAADIMTPDTVTVTPETGIQECCDVMENKQIRRILVVDEDDCCCGIVAQGDIARYLNSKQTAEVVKEISQPWHVATSGTSGGRSIGTAA